MQFILNFGIVIFSVAVFIVLVLGVLAMARGDSFNKNWSQKGGNATHVMKHIQLGDSPKIIWEKNIGDGETDGVSLTATPIVLDNKVVTLDTSGRVRAFRLRSGELQWETNLKPNEKDGAFGGGLGSGQNKVFISLGSGELVCLSIKDGKEFKYSIEKINTHHYEQ